jgi:glycosyltransferase involved in cell wall biosynthesis
MTITQIVPSLESHRGGTSVSVPQLSRSLSSMGHDVELLSTTPGAGSVHMEDNLRVSVFHRERPERICPSSGLRDHLAQTNSDIIHHHSLWLRTLHYAHRRARASGAKLVVSPRGMMSNWAWRHHFWRKQLARFVVHPRAFAGVAGWHATSQDEAAEIRGHGFKQPICVAPNGVYAPSIPERVHDADHWLAACPAVGTRPVALFYSRFHRKKRVLELIDLWVAHAPPEWMLLLVGIPEEFTPEEIERYALRASAGGRVRAFSGLQQPPPYAVAQLFLLPSHGENFGLVVAEAMSYGLPVLVTDATPWSGVNTDGRGWCVPWSEYGATLQAATRETYEQLRARGALARDWVIAEFSWEKSARDLAAFYQELKPESA